MRVVNPDAHPTQPRRMTASATGLAPSPNKLVDAGFVFVLTLVGLVGFATTYDSWYFMAVGAIGTALAILVAYVIRAFKWHWTYSLVGAVALYFVAGGPVAVRYDLIGGILPTLATEQNLAHLAINGWKELLTTYPPVDGGGQFLALPFALAVVFASASYALTRTYSWLPAGLIPQGILFCLVISLGAENPFYPVWLGLAWAVVAVVWMAYRSHVRGRLATSGSRSNLIRIVGGALMLALAGSVAYWAGPQMPGVTPPRDILRDVVASPIDVTQYPSPMPSLRKYSSDVLKSEFFHDKVLLTVDGAQPGDLVRFSVLDSYDGWVWGAGGGGFRRVGTDIPAVVDGSVVEGTPVDLTITIGDVYASQAPLNVWIPSLGYSTSIDFSGTDARDHENAMAYDMSKGQGLLLDQFSSGDVVHVRTLKMPVIGTESLQPAGPILVSDDRTNFLSPYLEELTGGTHGSWDQITDMAESFKKGGWTDGTENESNSRYLPGDGQGRLTAFLDTFPSFAGSDEHYSAAFALAANRLGYPTRVVFGAIMPDSGSDQIKGSDVNIWVEIHSSSGWVALPPSFFIPPRNKAPEPPPPVVSNPPEPVPDIAPANPQQPPDDLNGMNTKAQTGQAASVVEEVSTWIWAALIVVGSVVGFFALILGILLGSKAVRAWYRHRRGSPVHQISGGWAEVLDRTRDLGFAIPRKMTRTELASAMGLDPLRRLASSTDRAMFQQRPPDQEIVDDYWKQVLATKEELLSGRGKLSRFWVRITPRSLLPHRTF